ncbi:MAG: NtaA/DmoA family FMN-dependent monooxygenase [Burkholderiaceae bacterium]|nr:NtaA/DmoA family FMN-dependent monooxygenase [Burkholderiaceae bacterium]
MSSKIHLFQMLLHTSITHTLMGWADPIDQQLDGLEDYAYWQKLAQTLERGCFDGAFFADSPATHGVYKDSVKPSVEYGVIWPNHDPMPLVAVMSAVTKHLGLCVTLSTNGTSPYLATRRLSTLNYLSKGRIGWNIVSGFSKAEHLAAGLGKQIEHDERYDMADEFMEICYQLWDSVPADAILRDKKSGRFADPERVRQIDFKGKYFQCKGVGPVLPSPFGRPVLFQAGSSGRGIEFAMKHAEVIFSIQNHVVGMKKTMAQLKEAAEKFGAPNPKVVFGLQPIVRSTMAEAQQRARELIERIPLEANLARMSGVFGIDLSQMDPDKPLSDSANSQASRGLMAAAMTNEKGEAVTLREVAKKWALGPAIPQLIGTPESVADEIERIWRETGCHGFNLSPTTNPDSVEIFVDQVIPLLQKRGIFRTSYESDRFRDNVMS